MNRIKWIGKNSLESLTSPLFTIGKINGEVKNVVIALHGFGDNAANFSHLADEFNIPNTLWLFLQGAKNVPMGIDGAQWFPLFDDPKLDIAASENALFELVENVIEKTGLESEKIFLLGFSQGAAMALYFSLKSSRKFAGVLALSGFLVRMHEIIPILQQNKPLPPIFLAHGMQDQVLFPTTFFETKNILSFHSQLKVVSKTYNMGHTISPQEVADIKKFIEGCRN